MRVFKYKIVWVLFMTTVLMGGYMVNSAFARTDFDLMKDLEEKEHGESTEQETERIERPAVRYDTEHTRDPFVPYIRKIDPIQQSEAYQGTEEEPPPEVQVQGIIWGGRLTQAIINNRVVKKGDVIDDIEIIEISQHGIRILYNNRQYTIAAPASTYMLEKSEGGEDEE